MAALQKALELPFISSSVSSLTNYYADLKKRHATLDLASTVIGSCVGVVGQSAMTIASQPVVKNVVEKLDEKASGQIEKIETNFPVLAKTWQQAYADSVEWYSGKKDKLHQSIDDLSSCGKDTLVQGAADVSRRFVDGGKSLMEARDHCQSMARNMADTALDTVDSHIDRYLGHIDEEPDVTKSTEDDEVNVYGHLRQTLRKLNRGVTSRLRQTSDDGYSKVFDTWTYLSTTTINYVNPLWSRIQPYYTEGTGLIWKNRSLTETLKTIRLAEWAFQFLPLQTTTTIPRTPEPFQKTDSDIENDCLRELGSPLELLQPTPADDRFQSPVDMLSASEQDDDDADYDDADHDDVDHDDVDHDEHDHQRPH